MFESEAYYPELAKHNMIINNSELQNWVNYQNKLDSESKKEREINFMYEKHGLKYSSAVSTLDPQELNACFQYFENAKINA